MTLTSALLGVGAAMLSNTFYLTTSYVVKNWDVSAGEVTVFSACLRIAIFGLWSAQVKFASANQSYGRVEWFCLISSNAAISVSILLSYIAVTMLPLSDFIVFCFTAPVFTVLLVMLADR